MTQLELPNLNNLLSVFCVCLSVCGVGFVVLALVVVRFGFSIVSDLLGSLTGGRDDRKSKHPEVIITPRPGYNPMGATAQAAPILSFDEALARQQQQRAQSAPSLPQAGNLQPPYGYQPPAHPMPPPTGFSQPAPNQPFGAQTVRGGYGLPPTTPLPPVQPAPPAFGPRPTLTPGVPYTPAQPTWPPQASSLADRGLPNEPLARRRRERHAEDDRFEIYGDDEGGGGLFDLL